MAIHFVADLHFNAENARHALSHGFADCAERTRRICDVWRSRVAEDDTVWIIGNVGNPIHLAALPGTKHLVRGINDPRPWDCLTTGRYASVCSAQRLNTELGSFDLVCNPVHASGAEGVRVLHGHAQGTWATPAYICVSVAHIGWGPITLDEIVHGDGALRRAA